MHNPYTLLNPVLLQALLRQPLYLVRQSYPRGNRPGDKNIRSVLLTHYGHHATDLERVERHLRLLHQDTARFVYDSLLPAHRQRLEQAALQPAGCRVYINLIPRAWTTDAALKEQIRQFIRTRLPGWKHRPGDPLQITLQERYGELFVALRAKGCQMEVHLDSIENARPCAMT